MTKETNKGSVLLLTTISSFITPFVSAAVNIALPSIGQEFSLDAVMLGWIATSFLISSAVFLIPMGRLADIAGRKKLFMSGIVMYTLISLICTLAPTGGILIALRIIQGFASAMVFSTSTAILISVYPPAQRGRALGINTTAVYTGLSAGPFLGGLITQYFGWRSIFIFTALLSIIVAVLLIFTVHDEWAEARGERFDLSGSFIYVVSLLAFMYGFTVLPDPAGFYLILSGAAGIVFFIYFESRTSSPVLNIKLLLHNRVFVFSNLAALINYSATFAVGFLMSFFLQFVQGFTPRGAGIILAAQPVMMALLSPLAGKLSDKTDPRIVSSFGMALITAGLLMLAFMQESSSLILIIFSLLVLGAGFGLFSAPNTNAVMSSVEKQHYSIASSTLGTMRLSGQMFSMGIAILIFSIFIGHVKITPVHHAALLKSVRYAFIIFSVLCFAGIFASLSRGKMRRN